MFLSNRVQSLIAGLFLMLSATACGLFGGRGDTVARGGEEQRTRVPFKTTEPENFQCEILETAGATIRRKRLAKKGNWRRVDFDFGEPGQRTLLQTDKEYILDMGRGVYAETEAGSGGQFSELTHELLNTALRSEFAESTREGNMITYTVRPDGGDSSEVVVYFDESIGMPVKQEFFSLEGGTRALMLTVELVNFVNNPEADAFTIPAGFRKVTTEEMTR